MVLASTLTATPSSCDEAVVAVTVEPLRILALNDSARGSSKVGNTVLASVLTNDWLGSARATPSNVALSQVSLTPANSKIRLDLADGSIDVLGKTNSGLEDRIVGDAADVPTESDVVADLGRAPEQ